MRAKPAIGREAPALAQRRAPRTGVRPCYGPGANRPRSADGVALNVRRNASLK